MQKNSPAEPSQQSQHIPSLDLCRGLAAVGVLLFHMDFLFYDVDAGGHLLFPRGYLCVDFFFILSGYVIANSYDWKLADGLSAKAFIGIRIARLWPLVVLTCLAGLVLFFARILRDTGSLDIGPGVWINLLLNLAMLPTVAGVIAFPFNPAAWSIFFEMVANIFYALLFRSMRISTLCLLIALGLVGLIVAIAVYNTLDVGWSTSNIHFALPRVVYSFFLGVIVFRLRRHIQFRCPAYVLVAMLALAGLFLNVPVNAQSSWNGLLDFCAVGFFFPLLLIVAIGTRMPPLANALAWFLGGISYAVYLWQTPMVIAYSAIPQIVFAEKIRGFVPWAGWIFIPFLFTVAYLTWTYFERPAQRWLRLRLSQSDSRSKVA